MKIRLTLKYPLRFKIGSSQVHAMDLSNVRHTNENFFELFCFDAKTLQLAERIPRTMTSPHEITAIIEAISLGRADQTRDLLPLVYEELKQMAGAKLSQERPNHTLQPTALVHEAYMRLVGSAGSSWQNRAHFFGAAAEAMRRILVEHARGRNRLKRGGPDQKQIQFTDLGELGIEKADELIALDDALDVLREIDPEKAQLVSLKFFGGLSTHAAGEILGHSPRTAERHWAFARVWLYRKMDD